MTCVPKDGHVCTSLQTGSALPNGHALLTAVRFAGNVLTYAFELSQVCDRMLQRQHGRRKLSELDDQLLKDVGVTREQAERTARKWFWQ